MGSPESPWALETRGRPLCYNNVRHDLLGDRPRLARLPAPHAPHRRARGPLLDPLRGLLAPAHPGHRARHGPHPPAPAPGDPPLGGIDLTPLVALFLLELARALAVRLLAVVFGA